MYHILNKTAKYFCTENPVGQPEPEIRYCFVLVTYLNQTDSNLNYGPKDDDKQKYVSAVTFGPSAFHP